MSSLANNEQMPCLIYTALNPKKHYNPVVLLDTFSATTGFKIN